MENIINRKNIKTSHLYLNRVLYSTFNSPVDRDYPSIVSFDGLLEGSRYRKFSLDMSHLMKLSLSKAVRRADMVAVENDLLCGP